MKQTCFTLLLAALVFTACKNPLAPKERLNDFIPGTYVRVIDQQFAVGHDTVYLTQIDGRRNTYGIVKHAVLQRKVKGQLLPEETISQAWLGILDEKTGLVTEQKTGKLFRFDPDSNRLFIGSSPYQKLP